jgi:hypothetical protein
MSAIELSVLLVLCGIAATGLVVQLLRTALSQAGAIRRALDACPETRELRFTVREVLVSYDDGKVVPLRPRSVISLPGRVPVRAAA